MTMIVLIAKIIIIYFAMKYSMRRAITRSYQTVKKHVSLTLRISDEFTTMRFGHIVSCSTKLCVFALRLSTAKTFCAFIIIDVIIMSITH